MSRLEHCVSVPFHLRALFPNCRGENCWEGREGKKKRKKKADHILASVVWYVALSFWILLSTLDRQLNKKTHRLPMCLHGSWFSWKQWEGWNAQCAKPRSGVWGWVHHIYAGPQARGGKWLYCTRKVPPFNLHQTSPSDSLFLLILTLPSISQAQPHFVNTVMEICRSMLGVTEVHIKCQLIHGTVRSKVRPTPSFHLSFWMDLTYSSLLFRHSCR